MNRRGFLGSLGALASTIALDPEKLLWLPGKKLISIPKPEKRFISNFQDSLPMGVCNGVPIYWNDVVPDSIGPLIYEGGTVSRIVELRHHIHRGDSTIYAIPSGKLQVIVHGMTSIRIDA